MAAESILGRAMKLAAKIVLPFVMLMAVFLVISFFLVYNLKIQQRIVSQNILAINTLSNLNSQLNKLQTQSDFSVLSYRFDQNKAAVETITQATIKISNILDQMYPIIAAQAGQEAVQSHITARRNLEKARNDLLVSIQQNNEQNIRRDFDSWLLLTRNIQTSLTDLNAFNSNTAEKILAPVDTIRHKIYQGVVGLMAGMLVLLVLIYFYFTEIITKPILQLEEATREVAQAHFITPAGSNSRDEIGKLNRAFRSMALKLKESYEDLDAKVKEKTLELRRFQQAVDSATEAVLITGLDGKIIYVNKAWQQLTAYTSAEVLGKKPNFLKSGKTPKEVFEKLWGTIAEGKAFLTDKIINRRKDGSEYNAEHQIFPVRENMQNMFYVELHQDISKRKEVDRTKTEFVSLASHQLRTPLATMKWYGDMLLSDDVGALNSKQRQYMEAVYQSNERMVELVNALLNVSRIDMGTFTVDSVPTDVLQIAEMVIKDFAPQITRKKLKVVKHYDPLLPLINVDRQLLRMVLQNIMSNSIKYSAAGATIRVGIVKKDSNLVFTVADQGCGIPSDQQGKIFSKLFRGDNAKAIDPDGTGLGLYIVKSILDTVGGVIWFESKLNHGTTFYLSIPLAGMITRQGTHPLVA